MQSSSGISTANSISDYTNFFHILSFVKGAQSKRLRALLFFRPLICFYVVKSSNRYVKIDIIMKNS